MTTDQQKGVGLSRQIGARLVDLREDSGVSRPRAAQAIGVSVQTYANREKGITELKSSEMVILADLFGVDVADFFETATWSPSPEKSPSLLGSFHVDEVETFVRLLARISDTQVRQDLGDAVKAIARADAQVVDWDEEGQS